MTSESEFIVTFSKSFPVFCVTAKQEVTFFVHFQDMFILVSVLGGSVDWFPYDRDLLPERVIVNFAFSLTHSIPFQC